MESVRDLVMRYRLLFLILGFGLLICDFSFIRGQAPATTSDQQPASRSSFVLRSQTNIVLVDVRVRDRSGRPVTDLKQSDFKVFEDGVPQNITSFGLEN